MPATRTPFLIMMGAERPAPIPPGRPYDGSDFCLTTYCRGAHWHPRHPRLVFFMGVVGSAQKPRFCVLAYARMHKKT